MKEIFCKAFSNHICLTLHSGIKPCCRFDNSIHRPVMVRHGEKIHELLTDPQWVEAKYGSYETMPGCHKCEKEELVGKKSLREQMNQKLSGEENRLEFLEFSISSECNLKCRMCIPQLSTTWSKEVEANPILNKFELYKNEKDPYSLEILEKLDLSHLKRFTYLGGEPFVTPAIKDVFRILEERSDPSKIRLEISTNGTVFPKKHIETLSKFKQIHLEISIDAVGALGEYMRHGQPWSLIDKNVNQWLSCELDNVDLQISCTVQAYNILHLPELWKYSNNVGFSFRPHFHFLYHPKQLSAFLLPTEYKKLVEEKITNASIISDIDKSHIIDMMIKNNTQEDWAMFVDYTTTLDKIREESIKEVLPELGEYL